VWLSQPQTAMSTCRFGSGNRPLQHLKSNLGIPAPVPLAAKALPKGWGHFPDTGHNCWDWGLANDWSSWI
jgi:hypothetical protein